MYWNGDIPKYTEKIGLIFMPFFARDVAQEKSRLECRIYCLTLVYIVLCLALIYMITPHVMRCRGFVYIFGVHKYHVSNGTYSKSLDMAY